MVPFSMTGSQHFWPPNCSITSAGTDVRRLVAGAFKRDRHRIEALFLLSTRRFQVSFDEHRLTS
jgi:hypothetical protein